MPNPHTAFALSGGGSLGAVQVGMAAALYERGITPDLIVGTSVGALNAGFLASNPPTLDAIAGLADIWSGLSREEVFPVRALRGFLGFVGQRNHLVPNTGLRALMDEHLRIDRLEQAEIPIVVIATDLLSGREVELSEGPAQDAILASSAIPGVFPPIEWEGMQLVDGGISNNTPLAPAVAAGAKRVFVLPTGTACPLQAVPESAIGVLMHSLSLLVMRRLILEVEQFGEQLELVVLPPPCPLDVQAIDFSRTEELIRLGRVETHRYLDRLEAGEAVTPIRTALLGQ